MTYKPDIVRIFSELSETVKNSLSRDSLHFVHGYIEEINVTLRELASQPITDSLRYPAIMLIQPFTVTKGEDYYNLKNAQILIAINTLQELKAADRYVNTITPILYPIYDALLDAISRHSEIVDADPEMIEHELKELPFYGVESGGTANIFNDMIDCLMIDNLNLKINPTKNC